MIFAGFGHREKARENFLNNRVMTQEQAASTRV